MQARHGPLHRMLVAASVAMALAATLAAAGCVVAPRSHPVGAAGVWAPLPPPPLRFEIVPAPPYPLAYAWDPGHWRWDRSAFVWRPGRYLKRPHPSAAWWPGYWRQRHDNIWFWFDGRWH